MGFSELQMALVAIGSFIIFSILIYNLVRSRRLRNKRQSINAVNPHQSTLDDSRLEPGFLDLLR